MLPNIFSKPPGCPSVPLSQAAQIIFRTVESVVRLPYKSDGINMYKPNANTVRLLALLLNIRVVK